jgi:hypothetical protein
MRLSERGIMPKEQINSTRAEVRTLMKGDAGEPDGICIEVYEGGEIDPKAEIRWLPTVSWHWTPDAFGQLGMDVDTTQFLAMADELRQSLTDGTRAELPQFVHLYTAEMKRGEMQKMIAITRRVRNAVFGGDE